MSSLLAHDYLVPDFAVAVNGMPLPAEVARDVMEISAVSDSESIDHFRLTFANDYPDLPYTEGRHARLFQPGAKVALQLGYVNSLERVAEGELTSIGADFQAESVPTLRLEAHSPLHRLRGDARTRTYVEMTDSQVAQQLLAAIGTPAEVEATSVKHPYLIQYSQTDLAFLSERARRIRYVFGFENGVVRFRRASESESAALTLVWGNVTRGLGRQNPLLGFAPTLHALRPATKVEVRGLDPKSRQPILGQAASARETTGGGMTGPATRRRISSRIEQIVDVPVASKAEADELAKALYDRLAMEFVTGTGSTLGLPSLRSGRVVEIQGVGRFDGRYYVTRATHRFSTSGYLTTFDVHGDSIAR